MSYLLKCDIGEILGSYNYTIYNEKDEIIYKAKENGLLGTIDRFLSHAIGVKHNIYIYDISDNKLAIIKKKWALLKRKYEIKLKNNQIAIVNECGLIKNVGLNIKFKDNIYVVSLSEGNDGDFIIQEADEIKAIIKSKSCKIKNHYEVIIEDDKIKDLALAMAIIVDNMYHY